MVVVVVMADAFFVDPSLSSFGWPSVDSCCWEADEITSVVAVATEIISASDVAVLSAVEFSIVFIDGDSDEDEVLNAEKIDV